MGVQVVVVGKKHICPESDGSKPHVGGTVVEGIEGVLIDGMPVAVVGSKCECTGSPKPNSIAMGCEGILIDGKPLAVVGSMTEHGGIIIEGVPGVTISGPLVPMSGDPKKLEPKIFNLQWREEKNIVKYGKFKDVVILSADTVGYEDGEEVTIKVYEEGIEEPIGEVTGTVKEGRVEVEWEVKEADNKSENEER
ncbi:MAG: PAAR domain-containing protein [Prevotella sp.]|jgi:uncharacterized Zn-binding protein involved in type VI secretion|nr:PAAR domain-containing protein [Prevotella sp.]